MKKLFFMLVTLIITASVFAQKDEKSVGLNLLYGSKIENIGIGAKFNYNVTDPIRVSPSFNYFLKKDGFSMWEINADVHYLFSIAEKLKAYPLAGLTLVGAKFDYGDLFDVLEEFGIEADDSDSLTKFGINLGGGIKLFID
ncbi:porin family protein [Bacteroidales bacterium OttesenSCG-928-A17]|nr:porin family protein [Bacteroidales bacterium OttesenSCG-928-A17]